MNLVIIIFLFLFHFLFSFFFSFFFFFFFFFFFLQILKNYKFKVLPMNLNDVESRKPFEVILIGCSDKEVDKDLPEHKIIASIPSNVHSEKPNCALFQWILSPFLKSQSIRTVELFARNLTQNTISLGSEPISNQPQKMKTKQIEEKEKQKDSEK